MLVSKYALFLQREEEPTEVTLAGNALMSSEQLCALEAPVRVAKSLETSYKNMPGNVRGDNLVST